MAPLPRKTEFALVKNFFHSPRSPLGIPAKGPFRRLAPNGLVRKYLTVNATKRILDQLSDVALRLDKKKSKVA